MKKLGKLTLKEMSNEMAVISPSKLSELIGGSDTIPPGFDSAQDVWNFCWGAVAEELSPITDAISSAFETINDAKNNFTDWVKENNILETIGAGAVLAADLYLWWLSTVPVPGPTVVNPSDTNPSDTASGSTITYSL